MNEVKTKILSEVKNSSEALRKCNLEQLDDIIFKYKKSLLLTYTGVKALKLLFDNYTFEYDCNKMKARHRVIMQRYFREPYYIGRKKVTVFNQEDAVMLGLHGEFSKFLDGVNPEN